ncbi:MAG: phosphate ABC transporter permease PstA [Acidimicrobiia bacterium]
MATTAPTTTDLVHQALRGRRLNPVDSLVAGGLLLALLASLGILVVLLVDILQGGLGLLAERGWQLISANLSPEPARAGLVQGIMGSIAVTAFVVVIAFPLGVAAAVYLEEYARDNRLTRLINANIRNLAGVPSIVYGLLGLSVFVNLLGGFTNGRTVVSGGLTLAILVLPIMIITSAEALRAVPQELREASYGVGATRWETVRHQVLPVAAPAILTGTVLTVARAFGESAPLLLAGALVSNFFSVAADAGFYELITDQPYTVLPIVIFNWARQPQREFIELTFAAIIVLLVLLLTVNAAAILLRDRFERR